jgi:hypothetical protein
MNARDRRGTRIEALVIAVVLCAGALVWLTTGEHGAPPFAAPNQEITVAPRPTAPAQTPAQLPVGEQPGSVVPVRFERNGSSSPKTGPAPQPTYKPKPSPSPTSAPPTQAWTTCTSKAGALACTGWRGSFKCTTTRAGDTACKGDKVSFSCTTDPSTGARQCADTSDSWNCVTNADVGHTGCAGTKGSYSCSSTPGNGAAEKCTGSQDFTCYDDASGRHCGTAIRFNRDCYFEPIFGVYCRT